MKSRSMPPKSTMPYYFYDTFSLFFFGGHRHDCGSVYLAALADHPGDVDGSLSSISTIIHRLGFHFVIFIFRDLVFGVWTEPASFG